MSSLWRKLFFIPVYLFITALPLAGTIGANLEYEYSLLVSWLSLLLIPLAAIGLPEQYLPKFDGRFYAAPATEFFWVFLVAPAIALLSPLYMFFADLCLCSATGFGFWLVLMALPAWVLGHALMWAVLRARVSGFSRWRLLALFMVLILCMISFDGLSIWFNPQKRLVSLFSGFLHGPIYDDWIAVDDGIVLARLSHLLLACLLLVLLWFQGQKSLIVVATVLATGWLAAGLSAGKFASTSLGKASLDRLLQGTIKGDGFTLHYRAQNSLRPTHPLKYRRLARDTAFHIEELSKIFASDKLPYVHVYVYPDDQRKKLWFGGGSTDVADVRTPSIHISGDSWPHPTLRHELVHALASGHGFYGLGFHPNMAFTEGLAVALAPDGRSMSLDDGAASILADGRIESIEKLFSPLFWQVSGSRAYTVAGSFLKYLIRESGVSKVTDLYSGKSFSTVFSRDREKVLEEWKHDIGEKFDKERHAVFAEALFRYPGVFADQCPHSKEDLERRRETDVYVRLRQPLKWDPEQDYLQWRAVLDKDDRSVRMRIWRKSIHEIATDRVPSLGRLETWQTALKKFRRFPPQTLEDVEAGILESDLARLSGNTEASLAILKELQEADKKTFFGFSYQREIEARIRIERDIGDDLALEWRRFLAGWRRQMPDEFLFSGPWITTYLKVRNMKAGRISAAELEQAFAMDVKAEQLPPTFELEWYKMLGAKFMSADKFSQAEKAYLLAEKSSSGSMAELMAEHARRASFYAVQGPLRKNQSSASEGDP